MPIMTIRGEQYYTPLAIWHDGTGKAKRCTPPSQFPDLGGVSSLPV